MKFETWNLNLKNKIFLSNKSINQICSTTTDKHCKKRQCWEVGKEFYRSLNKTVARLGFHIKIWCHYLIEQKWAEIHTYSSPKAPPPFSFLPTLPSLPVSPFNNFLWQSSHFTPPYHVEMLLFQQWIFLLATILSTGSLWPYGHTSVWLSVSRAYVG